MSEPCESSPRNRALFSQPSANDEKFGDDRDIAFSELRDAIGELQTIAQRRLEQAGTQVHETIDARPWTSVVVAGLVGLALAVAVAPRRSRNDRRVRSIAGFDLPRSYQFSWPQFPAPHIPSVPSGYTEPLTGRLERVVDSISKIDPSTLNMPAFDRIRNWVGSMLRKDAPGTS
ncbi:MAG: hypothetical protein AB7O43_18515 [Hyphomicrobiaceae bacterium]